jgi:hypothetical protein
MPMRARRLAHALPALMLAVGSNASQAQSSYTLTILRTPNGNGAVPYDMNNAGKVVGSYLVLGITPGPTPTLKYRTTGVTWSGSTAASVTGVKVASSYVPLKMNQSDSTVGFKSSASYFTLDGDPVIEKSGKLTTLSFTGVTDAPYKVVLGGINIAGVVAGTDFTFGQSALIYKAGQFTRLERLANHISTFGNSINDLEQVAGAVQLDGSELAPGTYYDMRAAVWTNGKLSWVGESQTEARAINNAGQVLVARTADIPSAGSVSLAHWGLYDGSQTKGSASVRLGSSVQTIGREDQVVNPSGMNNAGTVVGCVDGVPFIWKNGVLLDLLTEITSKGIKLPAGALLDCPAAINDSGSILTSYQTNRNSTLRTWVRINAKP